MAGPSYVGQLRHGIATAHRFLIPHQTRPGIFVSPITFLREPMRSFSQKEGARHEKQPPTLAARSTAPRIHRGHRQCVPCVGGGCSQDRQSPWAGHPSDHDAKRRSTRREILRKDLAPKDGYPRSPQPANLLQRFDTKHGRRRLGCRQTLCQGTDGTTTRFVFDLRQNMIIGHDQQKAGDHQNDHGESYRLLLSHFAVQKKLLAPVTRHLPTPPDDDA